MRIYPWLPLLLVGAGLSTVWADDQSDHEAGRAEVKFVVDVLDGVRDPDDIRITVTHWRGYEQPSLEVAVVGEGQTQMELPELPSGPDHYSFRLDEKSREARLWFDPPALRVEAGQSYQIRVRAPYVPPQSDDPLQDALGAGRWREAYALSHNYDVTGRASRWRRAMGRLAGYKREPRGDAGTLFTEARAEQFSQWKRMGGDVVQTARFVGLHTFYLQPEPVLDDLTTLLAAVREIRREAPEDWAAMMGESALLYRMERFGESERAARRILDVPAAPPHALAYAHHRCAAVLYIQGLRDEAWEEHALASYPLLASGMLESYGGGPGLTPFDRLEGEIVMCESVMCEEIPPAMIRARRELVETLRRAR